MIQKKIVDRLDEEIEEEKSGVLDGSDGIAINEKYEKHEKTNNVNPVIIHNPVSLTVQKLTEDAELGPEASRKMSPLARHLSRYRSFDNLRRQPTISRY